MKVEALQGGKLLQEIKHILVALLFQKPKLSCLIALALWVFCLPCFGETALEVNKTKYCMKHESVKLFGNHPMPEGDANMCRAREGRGADQVGVLVFKACPELGLAVLSVCGRRARGLYDVITKQKHNYIDNCAGSGGGNRVINTENTIEHKEQSTTKEELSNISLYPNPNNGNFILTFNTTEKQNVEVAILDLNGKVVLSQTCISDNGKCEFNTNQLQKGFYTVKVNNEKSLKLLIK
jgi:Secretion system C-terminal sorting domain